ncbi:hypothetical protein FQN57_003022 [Myotisia sp. PD_48]|nr:hypothetical protein FQN57_003022 [Myotisia sp. PD_48]
MQGSTRDRWKAIANEAKGGPDDRETERWEVDYARRDPIDPGMPRRLMISRFDPVPKRDCLKKCDMVNMAPVTTHLEDDILSAETNGLNTTRLLYSSVAPTISSAGYTVIASARYRYCGVSQWGDHHWWSYFQPRIVPLLD